MVINENLLSGYSNPSIIEANDNPYHYIEYQIPDNLEENQVYTISLEGSQTNGSGKFSVIIFDKETRNKSNVLIAQNGAREHLTFKYVSELTDIVLVYSDIDGQCNGVGLTVRNVKIEKGNKATPYIPNKNSVDPSKQAIFKAGGYSKRCIHSKLKASRFRPVKYGGGVC